MHKRIAFVLNFFYLQLKKYTASTAYSDGSTPEVYKRCNTTQINKVRQCLRETGYLLNSKIKNQHVSIDGKKIMSEELVGFATIATSNTKIYIEAKMNKSTPNISPVYVTQEEYEEANSIENSTIAELKVLIYKMIDTLDKEAAISQQKIYDKTVKNKRKEKYIEFYYTLCELVDTENIDNSESEID